MPGLETERAIGYKDRLREEAPVSPEYFSSVILGGSVDDLVVRGIQNLYLTGESVDVTAGRGIQSFGVSYVLTDSRKRVHSLRQPQSGKYLARELKAYFAGSLQVRDGLALASPFWEKIADDDGKINSNYGYYVFHENIPGEDDDGPRTQYDWVIRQLDGNLQSRKALININQPKHKELQTKDFPCTTGIQFFTRKNEKGVPTLSCEVASRSTDIVTGLPYDMGFFSFLTELVHADLTQRGHDVQLGYTVMKPTFTQVYDRTAHIAQRVLMRSCDRLDPAATQMPPITDARATLSDIYNRTANTPVMQWVERNAA